MSTAQDRGWGNPGIPGSKQAINYRTLNIVKVEVAGITVYIHRAISYLAEQFIKELTEKYNYSLANTGGWDGGYANRNIFINGRDTGRKSNHSWGLALDLNASANPVSYDGRVHTNLPTKHITELAAKYGFFWGGNYSASGYRDPMHFEFLGTPADAVALTAKIHRAKRKATLTIGEKSRLHGRFVVVQEGEGWSQIAERVYGKAHWYPVIRNANATTKLVPGVKVYVPERLQKHAHKTVTARKGDTYKDLSRRYYGTRRKFARIKSANAGLHLHRGVRVKVPV